MIKCSAYNISTIFNWTNFVCLRLFIILYYSKNILVQQMLFPKSVDLYLFFFWLLLRYECKKSLKEEKKHKN